MMKPFRHICCNILSRENSFAVLCRFAASRKPAPLPKTVWDDSSVAPTSDRQFYYENPPMEGDAMYTIEVRAAPTRNYYSTFYDPLLQKLEKMVLKKGRGDLAYGIMNDTMRRIKLIQIEKYHSSSDDERQDIETNPLVIFRQGIQNATPAMGLRRATKGGATFQVPVPINDAKKFFITANWILEHCRAGKPNTPISDRLAKEILAAYNNEGTAVKNKQSLHRQIVANRAYIHMRWQ